MEMPNKKLHIPNKRTKSTRATSIQKHPTKIIKSTGNTQCTFCNKNYSNLEPMLTHLDLRKRKYKMGRVQMPAPTKTANRCPNPAPTKTTQQHHEHTRRNNRRDTKRKPRNRTKKRKNPTQTSSQNATMTQPQKIKKKLHKPYGDSSCMQKTRKQ